MTATVRRGPTPDSEAPRTDAARIKGWCPGALRPMPARDGLLVRLRPTGGRLGADQARAIAALGSFYGNGLFDLSARANLQLRGVQDDALSALQDALADIGLLDDSIDAEAVRNVLASPLAGFGGDVDIAPIVAELEARLASDATLHALPPKFGFLVDDGSAPGLAGIAADVRFDLLGAGGRDRVWIGLGGTRDHAVALGFCRPDEIVEAAAWIAARFLTLAATCAPPARRMAALVDRLGPSHLLRLLGADGDAARPDYSGAILQRPPVGWHRDGAVPYLGVAVPFGRLDHATLRAVADLADAQGDGTLRLTPWRTILLPGVTDAGDIGALPPRTVILDPDDPRLRLAACVGGGGLRERHDGDPRRRGGIGRPCRPLRRRVDGDPCVGLRQGLRARVAHAGHARRPRGAIRSRAAGQGRRRSRPALAGYRRGACRHPRVADGAGREGRCRRRSGMTAAASLRIVGLGPGDPRWITPEVTAAVDAATDLVGYAPYLARLAPRADQTVHGSDNRVELDRARLALTLTAAGGRVVVVSGGDPGIFAMAAAVFEAVEGGDPAWRDLDIAVCPGLSAMQAAAARLGAPLGHDFCAISLSDNLKPWSLVDKRLRAAADGDFVIALYNPASKARPDRIHQAFATLRGCRPSATPVVFARAIGRPDEAMVLTTLSAADPGLADMSTLVLIGSSETRLIPRTTGRPFVYTPRDARGEP